MSENQDKVFSKTVINWVITTYGKLLYKNKEGENMEIYLSKVKDEEKEILYRLLQYSLFEESENDLNEMNQ